jgi:hypothetical protein
MSIRIKILDRLLNWLLGSRLSPIGWINGYKTIIGNILTAVSGIILILQQALCGGIESFAGFCEMLDKGEAFTALLISLLFKLVGEWHSAEKELKELKQ